MSDKTFSMREIATIEQGKELLKGGLFVECRKKTGELRWGVRFTDRGTGKPRRKLLGKVDELPQQEARELADRIRAEGSDAFRHTTFMDAVDAISKAKEWSEAYKRNMVSAVNGRFFDLANNQPIEEFVNQSRMVMESLRTELESTKESDGKGVMYPKLIRLLARVTDWAQARGLCEKNPYQFALTEMPKIESDRHAAPEESALTDIWTDLNAIHDPKHVVKARAVKMVMLTGLRSTNVINMEWQDIKPATKNEIAHIHISKAKSKNRLEFTIPITPEVQRILDEQRAIRPLDSSYVFNSSKRTKFKIKLGSMVNELGIGSKYSTTAHGFRSAYISKLASVGIPEDIIKKSVGHNAHSVSLLPYDSSKRLPERYTTQLYYEDFIKGKNPPNPPQFT